MKDSPRFYDIFSFFERFHYPNSTFALFFGSIRSIISEDMLVEQKKKRNSFLQLIAGGTAGFVESSICHPLDTIKTRMQLRSQQSTMKANRAKSFLQEPNSIPAKSSLQEPISIRSMSSLGSGLQLTNQNPTSNKAPFGVGNPRKSAVSRHGMIVTASLGPIATARRIVKHGGVMSLYKGLTAVYCGIIPKVLCPLLHQFSIILCI